MLLQSWNCLMYSTLFEANSSLRYCFLTAVLVLTEVLVLDALAFFALISVLVIEQEALGALARVVRRPFRLF